MYGRFKMYVVLNVVHIFRTIKPIKLIAIGPYSVGFYAAPVLWLGGG